MVLMNIGKFDYFKANETEQYLFYQLPVLLIKDDQFKSLSSDAKILYSLMLSRTSLSAKNGWLDEHGNVFIIYTLEEVMEGLNCRDNKATKSLKELREIGLIKTVRRGLGKPNITYVMNFATRFKYSPKTEKYPSNHDKSKTRENHDSRIAKITV